MNITEKSSKEFTKAITDFVLSLGGIMLEESPTKCYNMVLNTIVGKMLITVYDDHKHCYSVFCRFSDVKLAKEKFTCNKYSGKYNIHISEPLIDAIELAKVHIETTQ